MSGQKRAESLVRRVRNSQQVVVPPLLMITGGIITWFLKTKSEELRTIETKLSEQRRKVYDEILEPYIRIFVNFKDSKNMQEATSKILSYDYRKTAFNLSLFGSDGVVRAYNALMRHFFQAADTGRQDAKTMMYLWGDFLLEIRKSLGNKRTKLKQIEMLEAMIKDINKILS